MNRDQQDVVRGHEVDPITRSILVALADGHDEQSAARHCCVSARTFRRRLQLLRAQWGMDTNIEMVVHAVRARII